ncbi:MAG TPA: type II secretion system protein [Phycisphaerales bacterium]|nr:type II secretion system protein [Phycisphaerales bacterium]
MTTKSCKAFTLVEVAVTIVIVVLMTGTAMTILDRIVGALMDMRLQNAAFETARQNMESLLSLNNVKDTVEYGVSEIHPEIQWQVVIEPFHEPINNAMWVRAICSAGYTDSKGDYQEVELEHWLTNLPGAVVRQILQQQRAEEEYLSLLSGTAAGRDEAAIQETTIAYLEQAALDVDAYTSFLERQRRKKLDYISKYGFDDDYPAFIEELREEENRFLDRIGMDFDKYNDFSRTYVPQYIGWSGSGTSGSDGTLPPGTSGPSDGSATPSDPSSPSDGGQQSSFDDPQKVWTPDDVRKEFPGIPEELIPFVVYLMNL